MALFRFHKGTLEESLKTTIIVKDIYDLLEKLACWWEKEVCISADRLSMYQWQLLIDKKEKFDDRCGWYSHLVIFQVRNSDNIPVGFLSEPLEKWSCRDSDDENYLKDR